MSRVIPIASLLAAVTAAGVRFYPLPAKTPSPTNEMPLSGKIEAHEGLVSFKVLSASTICQWSRAHCWLG